jgi:carbonic anhydrase
LNLQLTDGTIIFRNVGGHVGQSINDILALDGFMKINDIVIIHHTDCGTTHFKDPVIREGLKERLPEHAQEIDGMAFGAIDK